MIIIILILSIILLLLSYFLYIQKNKVMLLQQQIGDLKNKISTAQISGSGNRRTPRTSADHLCFQVVDSHSFSPSFRPSAFLFLFRKKKMGVAEEAIPIAVKNIRLMFFTGRRQVVSKTETTVLLMKQNIKPSAWTMTAAPP